MKKLFLISALLLFFITACADMNTDGNLLNLTNISQFNETLNETIYFYNATFEYNSSQMLVTIWGENYCIFDLNCTPTPCNCTEISCVHECFKCP